TALAEGRTLRNGPMIPRTALACALLLILPAGSRPAAAQAVWEANIHAATLVNDLFEESGNGVQAGGRLVYTTPWRVTVGGNFDWARLSDIGLGLVDGATADLLLFSGEIGYAAPVSPRAELMLAAGVGAVTVRLRDVSSLTAETSSSGQLVPVGLGIRLRNREVDASWAFRADLRDDIIFLDILDPASGEIDQEPRHNWEISAGVSFLFGAGGPASPGVRPAGEEPAQRPVVRPQDRPAQPAPGVQGDADRDGVPDRLDRCTKTPAAMAVGATGCPIDVDRDGVPDRRVPQVPPDRPPVDEEPEARQPAVEPAPPAADGRDTDRDGVPDVADRCVNTPAGAAVDEQGCPAPPAEPPAEAEAPAEEEARPAAEPPDEPAVDEPPADEAPEEEADAAPLTVCLDDRPWDRPGITIAFDGRLWQQLGPPEPITLDNLTRVGEFDGVPIYVASAAERPYSDLWVPRCSGAYQLYVEEGSEE
ncbi:MAG: thrombospondin type 3 repeat-containing protein, partial [Gemmatimonadota bacterium]